MEKARPGVPDPPGERPNLSEILAESVTLSWNKPTHDGGSCVTGYIVEFREFKQVTWNTLITGVDSTSYIARGLQTGSQYRFRIRAHNVHGNSEASKPSQLVTIENQSTEGLEKEVEGVPDPPVEKPNLSEVTAESVTLSWRGPAFDGRSCVTGYIVESREFQKATWNTLITGIHSTSYIARGLKSGSQYRFRIRAQNVLGYSLPSKPSQLVTIENNPTKNDQKELEEKDEDSEYPPFEVKEVKLESGDIYDTIYDTFEELGKGNFGVVCRCVNKETGQNRAVKFIKCIRAKDKKQVKDEISIMNSLQHPKLLQLTAAYERPKQIVLVMEYITGGELFEQIVAEDFSLTERDCILFVRQICEGVQYMHDNMILHLDLKPENILCVHKRSHQIKLIDFGLARRFNPDNPLKVNFGTAEYIAPEIISYDPVSFTTDMWAIGVICYNLLSGAYPFMGKNETETLASITRAKFDFDDDAFNVISEDAKNFIIDLLNKRKEKRLLASECLKHKWLAQNESSMNKKVLSTDKLKKLMIRRKLKKAGNAIRALSRMKSLTDCLSSLQDNNTPHSTSPTPISSSHSVISEKNDSGISDCSFIENNSIQST